MDTEVTSGVDAPKADPRDVAVTALDGIEAGAHEGLADDVSDRLQQQHQVAYVGPQALADVQTVLRHRSLS